MSRQTTLLLSAFALLAVVLGVWLSRSRLESAPVPGRGFEIAPPRDAKSASADTRPLGTGSAALPAVRDPVRHPEPVVAIGTKGRLRGRVVDSLGTAIPDCDVVIATLDDIGRPEAPRTRPGDDARTRSGAEGRFEIDVGVGPPLAALLAHREFPMRVAAYGFHARAGETLDLGALVLHTEPGLQIDVFADGKPVSGARLELTPALTDTDLPRAASTLQERLAASDEQGHAVFYGLVPQLYRLRVDAPGYASSVRDHDHGRNGERSPVVRLDLEPGVVVRGRVLGPDTVALSDARIVVTSLRTHAFVVARSDRDGAFRVPGLSRGPAEAFAETAEYGRSEPVRCELGGDDAELVLGYARGSELTGTVTAAEDGRPLTGARVHFVRRLDQDHEVAIALPEVVTGATGTFRLAQVPPGGYVLHATAPDRAPTEFAVTIGPEPAAPVVVRLERSSACTGRVVDPAGRPVADAIVEPIDVDDDGSTLASWLRKARSGQPGSRARSDANGLFTVDGLAPGHLRLRVHREGFPDLRTQRIELGAGRLFELGTVALVRGGRVRGTAWEEPNRPAAGAIVTIEPLPEPNLQNPASAREAHRVIADDAGRFEFGLLGPGRYEMVYHLGAREPLASAAASAARTKAYVQVSPGADLVQDLHRSPK